jgi:hypothetical protein
VLNYTKWLNTTSIYRGRPQTSRYLQKHVETELSLTVRLTETGLSVIHTQQLETQLMRVRVDSLGGLSASQLADRPQHKNAEHIELQKFYQVLKISWWTVRTIWRTVLRSRQNPN